MKQILVLVVLLFSAAAYTQTPNWTNIKTTNINVNSASSVDIFTNGAGNHIIVQESNTLKYYKMDVNGTAGAPITLENTSVVSPSISGDATRIYAVYRKSSENFIRTKCSSDGGNSWSYISNLTNPSGSAASIECVFSNNRLHVVYQISNVIYYAKYEGSSWSSPATVSTNENGTGPRITALYNSNNDRVYFYYKKLNTHIGKWREYNLATGVWGNLWDGYSLSNVQQSGPNGFRVDDTRIYLYYWYYAQDGIGEWRYFLNWRILNKSNNTLLNSGTPDIQLPSKIYSTYTANGLAHSVFYYTWLLGESQYEVGIWRSNITNGYPSDLVYKYTDLQYYPNHLNLSSASNDVYVIWQDALGGNNLRLIYDDQTPLAPQNLTVSVYYTPTNGHPKLDWTLNNEPDVRIANPGYLIFRKIDSGSDTQIATVSGTTSSYIDYGINYAGSGMNTAYYKIVACDVGNYTSPFSNEVSIRYGNAWKVGSGQLEGEVLEYNLAQNYPNPFNPTTTINYSIKTAGEVTLKVYDMLGKEVASLVNENQEAGNYSVTFNASELPSGIYFYTLTSGNFIATKKLILLK